MRTGGLLQQTLFLESTNSLCTDFHLHFFAIDDDCFGLQIWLPNFFSVPLREAHVVAKLLAFAGNVTLLHRFSLNTGVYCICSAQNSQHLYGWLGILKRC